MFRFLSPLMNRASARRRCRAGQLRGQAPPPKPAVCRLYVERLEERQCLSAVLLVSDTVFLTRIDRDDLARLAAPAAPDGAGVPRHHGGEPEAAGGEGALGLKPPVGGCAK